MKEVLRLENINKTYQAKNGEIEALQECQKLVHLIFDILVNLLAI